MEIHIKKDLSSAAGQYPNRARMLISCPDGPECGGGLPVSVPAWRQHRPV